MGFEKNLEKILVKHLGFGVLILDVILFYQYLGPTTARDAFRFVGNTFLLDPVYQITHNTEQIWSRKSNSEHNYYYL